MINSNINKIIDFCENINSFEKKVTLCFTGHRSQKLPWKFNEDDIRCIEMRRKVKEKIEESILQGYVYFISGMAIGFDMICAKIILELKNKYSNIKLIVALCCKNQYSVWKDECIQTRYKNILNKADKIWCESDIYTKDCALRRNDYMLNNSSKVIALYNNIRGGTTYTLKRAKEKGLDIVIIKP